MGVDEEDSKTDGGMDVDVDEEVDADDEVVDEDED